MVKKQGKIKAISVKEVTEGMQVLWNQFICTIYKDSVFDRNNHYIDVVANLGLKTLVVEYEEYRGLEGGLGKPEKAYNTRQLPLKKSQWQAAIDNGEVDSDKVVEFEIILGPEIDGQFKYAKIIPQKKEEVRMSIYQFDMAISRAYNAGKQAMLDQRDGAPFKSSIEYFKQEFPEYARE